MADNMLFILFSSNDFGKAYDALSRHTRPAYMRIYVQHIFEIVIAHHIFAYRLLETQITFAKITP